MNLNKVQLIGRLGKPPEIKTMADGDKIATIALATSESWKDKITNEWKDKTEWHKIVAFGYNAEKAEKMAKGALVYIEGQLQTRKWTDSNGIDKYTTEIVLQKYNGTLKGLEKNITTNHSKVANSMDDDIPF